MAEVTGARLAAERELAESRDDWPTSADEIRRLRASPTFRRPWPTSTRSWRAKVYAELGITITYEPGSRVVVAEARPACTNSRVGGPDTAKPDWRIQPWDQGR